MITKEKQLQNRGFLAESVEVAFKNTSFHQKIVLLKSTIATERTLGARLLISEAKTETVDYLIEALTIEKKLYPKIAICNTLSSLGELAINPLIACLGQIGNNQHKKIPESDFKKDSYPLPRDIVSRTLIRIGVKAIPNLLNHIDTKDIKVLSALIDAIGYINFYHKKVDVFLPLKKCFYQHKKNDVIIWKIIRAFSGVKESEAFLNEYRLQTENPQLKLEIERSVRLIRKSD